MNKFIVTLLLGSMLLSHSVSHAADSLNAEQYFRDRGWKAIESKGIARSPSPDLAPLMYYQKGSSGPSCGLLAASATPGKPNFIELVSADADATYPYCMNVMSMTPFRLNGQGYIAVEFVQRDTREEFYRHFVYLHRDVVKGYVVDESLDAVDPASPGDVSSATPKPSTETDGVRLARSNFLSKAFPQWRFLDRHFISDKSSSFATMEEKKTQECHFVVEAGAAPVALNHTDFAPGTGCHGTLASGRLEKTGTTYYLAIFKTDKGEQAIAVISVHSSGQVVAEQALSYSLNRSGSTKDIKSAKAALSKALR